MEDTMKYIKLIFTIFICFILCGCFLDDPKYITFETKPTTYYYSDELYSKLKENPSFTLQVFDCILYKYYDVPVDDYDIVESFLTSLHTENFLMNLKKANNNIGLLFPSVVQNILLMPILQI